MHTELQKEQRDSPIDLSDLASLADRHREEYMTAFPWPHVVLDDLVEPAAIAAAEAQEIGPALDLEVQYGRRIVKAESPGVSGEAARIILESLCAPQFVAFLEELTDIPGLITDPTHYWAGLHVGPSGAFHALHRDFRVHPSTGLFHRVNVLVFLNSDWKSEYRGELELWPEDASACGQRIRPLAGKVVIFETTPVSLHAIPEPVRCPPGRARLSLASFYYTEGPGPIDRKERRFFVPRRPQDPWYFGVGGLKETVHSVWRLARDSVTPGR